MHDTALHFAQKFFETYTKANRDLFIAEIGSLDVNGSLRSVAPNGNRYVGLDFVAGAGVDRILDDPYQLPFEDQSVDVMVSSSCFEHSEFFWLLFQEVLRTLEPNGLFYLNAPSNGQFHRYPVDCWRFYPDAGVALQNWGRRVGYRCALLESFVGRQRVNGWNDFVAVFVKDVACVREHPYRISILETAHTNCITFENRAITSFSELPEDQQARRKIQSIAQIVNS